MHVERKYQISILISMLSFLLLIHPAFWLLCFGHVLFSCQSFKIVFFVCLSFWFSLRTYLFVLSGFDHYMYTMLTAVTLFWHIYRWCLFCCCQYCCILYDCHICEKFVGIWQYNIRNITIVFPSFDVFTISRSSVIRRGWFLSY